MHHTRCASSLGLAVLSLLASAAVPARGSEKGFHEYLKHHQNDPVELPRLYEPVPKHVPEMSDQALLRLWHTNQFSPILRSASMEIQLAEAVIAQYDHNPARFEVEHPLLGRILSDPSFYDYAMYLYHLDTPRFVHYHHWLIPVLRGIAMMPTPSSSSGTAPQQIVGPSTTPVSPPPSGTSTGPSPPPEALTIPEPSGVVIMGLGLAYVLLRLTGHRLPLLP